MDKTIKVCDHCGKDTAGTRRFLVPMGTQIDVPSGKTDTVDKAIDLCPDAQARIVSLYIDDVGGRIGNYGIEGRIGVSVKRGQEFLATWKEF